MLAQSLIRLIRPAAMCGVVLLLAGCSGPGPSAVNNQLRAKLYDDAHVISRLQAQHEADQAAVVSLQNQRGTLPTLPQSRLDQLVTAAGLRIGRLTGGYPAAGSPTGSQGVQVYVVPIDLAGDPLKAAGSFTVEALDLADAQHPLVGRWTFDPAQTRANWYGAGLLYTYVLTCPWQTPPHHATLMLRVTFFDELTQRELPPGKKDVTVELSAGATTAPATQAGGAQGIGLAKR